MQTASAFGQVQGSLSYIVDSYINIATWRAVIERLTGFNQSIHNAEAAATPTAGFERATGSGNALKAVGLTVNLPGGATLLKDINLTITPGHSLLITGASGAGKSTLLRTLAGLWPYAQGRLSIPTAPMLFLPQKPYLPLGSLREVLCYPSPPLADDAALIAVLTACRLGHLTPLLDKVDYWSYILSLGEQQRIAFARILLARPDFVFMDEATSALDETAEAHLYTLIKSTLPNVAMVSVGHRPALRTWHEEEMALGATA
jgi:putative ATP-binding cassette transporter